MRLVCYATSCEPPKIIPAPFDRPWMDKTSESFAYRCLPLNIANAHGWLILNSTPFVATWNGGVGLDAVVCRSTVEGSSTLASSHFGSGVLTFQVQGLFRTEPGYDLLVTGPFNHPKDAIYPLSGIVETDWAPFTFTMNWRFTRTFTPVSFERDEPFCMIFPIKRGLVEETEPEIRSIAANMEIQEAYTAWADSRRSFNEELKIAGSQARLEKWQKHYFKGALASGESLPHHRTKLRARPFSVIEGASTSSKKDAESTSSFSAPQATPQTPKRTPNDATTWGNVRRNESCPCG